MRLHPLAPSVIRALAGGALALWGLAAFAQDTGRPTGSTDPASQVVVPQVERRDVKLPRIPSNDFEVGLFGGTYATQSFGARGVAGIRLGYHVTEDFFFEAAFAQTKVSDEAFRQILPGGLFVDREETLRYGNLSVGWNVLPGEVFIGRGRALASTLYVIGGLGTTKFVDQSRQTFNLGVGSRVFLRDWVALQVDMRDHIYKLDILGKLRRTHNLELTGGITFFF
jgi:outer membrane beta-barrel protein